jgi:hypothetical protein
MHICPCSAKLRTAGMRTVGSILKTTKYLNMNKEDQPNSSKSQYLTYSYLFILIALICPFV